MIIPILFGVAEVAFNVMVQSATVVVILHRLLKYHRKPLPRDSYFLETWHLASIMVILFLGHMVQIMAWAAPFRVFGQFNDLETAFYHSAVNYTSLGYGDIVMTGHWRLLGALEAANGVLMFGVSTATFFAILSAQFKKHREVLRKLGQGQKETAHSVSAPSK
jgi:hypothetical protein